MQSRADLKEAGMAMRLRDIESRLPPGFRFHPSEEELVGYYLRAKVFATTGSQRSSSSQLIVSPQAAVTMLVEVDLHVREPWDLPVAAKLGDKQEWYFFSSRDRKYARGSRTNRATPHGYWKATGKDKVIHDDEHGNGMMMAVGMRKTLVFYFGRAPNGRKSDWVMHEFRLVVTSTSRSPATETPPPMEDWVLCRVFHKGKGEADDHGGGNHLVDMLITSSSSRLQSLCSPPQPADSSHDGGQLFPISVRSSSPTIISGKLVGDDYGHIMGQDAVPDDDPAMIRQQAAAGDGGFVEFSEWPDANAQMDMGYGENCIREMEMVLLQQGGNNYFDPCT